MLRCYMYMLIDGEHSEMVALTQSSLNLHVCTGLIQKLVVSALCVALSWKVTISLSTFRSYL